MHRSPASSMRCNTPPRIADVINNSWVFSGYGIGEPTDPFFASWYAALAIRGAGGRGGLGDVVVFAAGNDRADANDVGLQPINANPQVIAVAASDADGTVASYSNPGAGLLVAAVGDAVAVPMPGGQFYALANGTSYAAPTIAAISAMMLSVNPTLGWRDVQEILADSAYVPAPSAAGFSFNGATGLERRRHALLQRPWLWRGGCQCRGQSGARLDRAIDQRQSGDARGGAVDAGDRSRRTPPSPARSAVGADIRVQHVQVEIADVNLLAANTEAGADLAGWHAVGAAGSAGRRERRRRDRRARSVRQHDHLERVLGRGRGGHLDAGRCGISAAAAAGMLQGWELVAVGRRRRYGRIATCLYAGIRQPRRCRCDRGPWCPITGRMPPRST